MVEPVNQGIFLNWNLIAATRLPRIKGLQILSRIIKIMIKYDLGDLLLKKFTN
jgi:hypothetical protein